MYIQCGSERKAGEDTEESSKLTRKTRDFLLSSKTTKSLVFHSTNASVSRNRRHHSMLVDTVETS